MTQQVCVDKGKVHLANDAAKIIADRVKAKAKEERDKFSVRPGAEISSQDMGKAAREGQDGDAWLLKEVLKGQYVYDYSLGEWFRFAGHSWELDSVNSIYQATSAAIDLYSGELVEITKKKIKALDPPSTENAKIFQELEALEKLLFKKIKELQKKAYKADVLFLARSGPDTLGISGQEWDMDPWKLGCANGVLDLKTGDFRPGRPEDYIRTACPTEWKGINEPCPTWERFQNEIMNQNTETVNFKQRLYGYSITGHRKEHILPIAVGDGRKGKGTEFEALEYTLGSLAGAIQGELLLEQDRIRNSAAPSPDILALRGKRLVWASETNEGRKLNEGKVKWLCGGDTLVGRAPFGKTEINFKPTHTLFLMTNHKPKANPNDYALWQRIHLIEYSFSFVDNPTKPNERQRDPDLPEKLKAEASGILAWLVRGCLAWQREGLNPPATVKDATREYQTNEDDIGKFIENNCILGPDERVKVNFLYESFLEWSGSKIALKTFSRDLLKRYDSIERLPRTKAGYFYKGLSMKSESDEG